MLPYPICLFRGFSYKRRSPKFSQKTFQKPIDKTNRLCYNITVAKINTYQWGYSSVGRALEWHSRGQGFDSPYLHQQKENFCLPKVLFLFIQAAGLVYHRRAKRGVYHQGRLTALVSHHAPACIFLRLDEIQHCVLMIYRNKLRMIYKAYALICLQKCGII